jgi:D-alanyl-lipoteichoic acid acyltransferase DltB (MBOAT superfamily)
LFSGTWLVYQFAPDRHRWAPLLLASAAFYAVPRGPILLLSLAGVVAVSYCAALAIAGAQNEARRKRILSMGIGANMLVLFGVKYLRQLTQLSNPSLVAEGRCGSLFLTLGVSYYTLQAVSYLVDVYFERVEPESDFGRCALYLCFFPKLLQGPIERAQDLLPQLRAPYEPSYRNLRNGLLLFAWGLFKKVAVANRLATYVNTVYGDVHGQSGVTLILATYMYAIQILADFSGYTDMALGVALLFNIRLTQNFIAPYRATSIVEFWRRWHISFSRWILDYIFKPLQVRWRDSGNMGMAGALLTTFLFSGIWHGVSWNFIVWGALHGFLIVSSVLFKPGVNRALRISGESHALRQAFQVVVTFNLVAFTWIFFRANSLSDAWYVVTHLLSGVPHYLFGLVARPGAQELLEPIMMEKGTTSLALLLAAVTLMVLGSTLKDRVALSKQAAVIRWSLYYALILAIIQLGIYDDAGFVYFQF